jgi:tripartite-type tricarboxylate transporter receptor subunit TctC
MRMSHLTGLLLASVASFSSFAYAQTAAALYPVKLVRVIVPFPPGSGVDIVTRIVVPRLAESVGQSFVVDNRGGAGGIVGTELAARAPADGYTLYMGGSALIITPLLGKVPYSARDFAAISRVASVPFILVVHPSVPARSLRDLIALAKTKPRTINYASTGNGTTPHMTTELFRREAQIEVTHVPYKGSAPALTDLLGGHVDMFFCNMLSATAHVSSGKLRALAVTSLQRAQVAPQVPTVAESGFPNFEAVTWFGLFGPAGVPEPVIGKLHAEMAKVLRRTDVQSELASQGASPTFDKAPGDMAHYVSSQTRKWEKVIQSLDTKMH